MEQESAVIARSPVPPPPTSWGVTPEVELRLRTIGEALRGGVKIETTDLEAAQDFLPTQPVRECTSDTHGLSYEWSLANVTSPNGNAAVLNEHTEAQESPMCATQDYSAAEVPSPDCVPTQNYPASGLSMQEFQSSQVRRAEHATPDTATKEECWQAVVKELSTSSDALVASEADGEAEQASHAATDAPSLSHGYDTTIEQPVCSDQSMEDDKVARLRRAEQRLERAIAARLEEARKSVAEPAPNQLACELVQDPPDAVTSEGANADTLVLNAMPQQAASLSAEASSLSAIVLAPAESVTPSVVADVREEAFLHSRAQSTTLGNSCGDGPRRRIFAKRRPPTEQDSEGPDTPAPRAIQLQTPSPSQTGSPQDDSAEKKPDSLRKTSAASQDTLLEHRKRAEIGHSLNPAQQGMRVAVIGDGWGGGKEGYEAVVTEADHQTFTVVCISGDNQWQETHVLKEFCIVLADEGSSAKEGTSEAANGEQRQEKKRRRVSC